MADFTAKAPVEEIKVEWLHDRESRPKHPPVDWRIALHRYWPLALGLFLALGFQALSYETRAGWSERRDWVEPSLTVFWAAAGMCAGMLFARRVWMLMAPGIFLLIAGLGFTTGNIIRHEAFVDGPDAWLTALDIFAVLCYAAMMCWFFGALVWLEMRNPLKVQPPEM